MKVLGLVASPRKLGNSEIIAKEILAALPAEAEKELVRLPDLDIQACKACYACLAADQACSIKDDLGPLLEKIRAADAVVIASACYFLGPHTSVKIVGDRLISVLANTDFAGKRCVTAVVYGIPGWEGYAREAVLNFARFLHLDVVGDMLVQAASPGEAVTPETLAEARQMAARLVEGGDGELPRPGLLTCSHCGSSLLQLSPTGEVRCVMCDSHGRLKGKDGRTSVEFDRREHYRFSSAGRDEHVQLLAEIRQRYLKNRNEYFKCRKPYEGFDYWWAK